MLEKMININKEDNLELETKKDMINWFNDMKKKGIPEQCGGGFYIGEGMVLNRNGEIEEQD